MLSDNDIGIINSSEATRSGTVTNGASNMTDTITKVKRPRKLAAKPKAAIPAPTPAPKPKAIAPKAAKPTVSHYDFASGHVGPSDGVNLAPSRVAIDFSRFGTLKDAKLTDRDNKNIEAMRIEFGNKQFERGNLDTGILRRLGERGIIKHVSGDSVDPRAKFQFIKAA